MLPNGSRTDEGSQRVAAGVLNRSGPLSKARHVASSRSTDTDEGLTGRSMKRILFFGEELDHMQMVGQALERAGDTPLQVDFTSSADDLVAQCLAKGYEALLMLLPQPVARGFKVLEQLQRNLPALPIVVLGSGTEPDPDLASRFLLHGAQDFLDREHVDAQALYRALTFSSLRKQHVRSSSKIRGYEVNSDTGESLTKLPGRGEFKQRCAEVLRYCNARRQQVAILLVDLDGYSAVLRELGIEIADQVLKTVSERLRGLLPGTATLGHFGGPIFAVAVPDIGRSKNAVRVAHSIIGAISQPIVAEGRGIGVGCRVGISLAPRHGDELDTLLKNADQAMVLGTPIKRNEYRIFGATTSPSQES
jgi:diguanylate cyclase (GGDEF)-like protein